MKAYQYVVARFVPDAARNEPVNVGIIVSDPATNKACGRFIEDFGALRRRCPGSNTAALQIILDAHRGEYVPKSKDFLSSLNQNHMYQLVFLEPRVIKSEATQAALDYLYGEYVSIDEHAREPNLHTKRGLKSEIDRSIDEIKLDRRWVKSRFCIDDLPDKFKFDYAFENGRLSDLLHVISFATAPKDSLIQSKSLALTAKYVGDKHEDVSMTALLHPPADAEQKEKYYEPAREYLKAQGCATSTREQIPAYLTEIKRKFQSHHA